MHTSERRKSLTGIRDEHSRDLFWMLRTLLHVVVRQCTSSSISRQPAHKAVASILVMAGSGFCKPHTCSGEEGGRRLTSIHHRQRWRDPSPRVADMSNRLIVVSNRLPLTLRKADGRWTTDR